MKAFLAWHDTPFRKTHNLEELGMQCAQLGESLKSISEQASPLTAYAWRFRYPGDSGEPDRVEAEQALTTARKVFDAIFKRLPPG
jgi:hypothetical protein